MFLQQLANRIVGLNSGYKRYFFHTSWNLLGRIFTLVVAFFVNIYVIRSLGPSNYGVVSYVLSYAGLFSCIASLGIDNVLYINLIENPEKKDKLLGSALVLRLFGSFVAIILTFISVLIIHDTFYNTVMIMLIACSFIFQPLYIINLYFQAKVFSKPTVINYFVISILLLLLKVLVIYFGLGMKYYISIFALESLLTAVGYVFIYYRHKQNIFNWRFDVETAKGMFIQSWPLVLSSAFVLVYSRIDQIMINHLINSTAVGIYDSAVRLAEFWYFIPATVVGSVFPAVVNARLVDVLLYEKRLVRLYSVAFYLALVFVIPITLFSDKIIQLLYGVPFFAAGAVLRIYVWAGIFSTFGIIVNQVLVHDKLTKISFVISFVAMFINIILNIILIPKFGINGAAFATLISYAAIPLSTLLFNRTRRQGLFMFKALILPKRIYDFRK